MIKKISIENFKSIKDAKFDFGDKQDIVCLIGKNGSGKSNIFKAIKYFFDNISRPYSEEKIIDNSNPYIQKCTISILFDLKLLREKSKYNPDLKSKFSIIDNYLNEHICNPDTHWELQNKKELELTLTQYKDGTITWNVDNKKIRETVKSLFPIYYLDTRRLDIFTWEHLWKIISDLSAAMPQKSQEDCRDLIDTTFTEIYGDKYRNSKDRIEKVFSENGISLDPYHFDSKYKNAFSMRFGGEQFLVDGQPLTYFSDGTNSYNYLILLSTLIPQISEISCKYPIVLLDEPETGLHSEYISKFVDAIFNNVKNNSLMFFSTHSPKLISDLTNNQVGFQLYKINRIGLHSEIHKMNTAWLTDSKHKITVKETECYFYDYLVYLEGETEVGLFNNKRLKSLFKKLNKVHFYSFDGNEERLDTVNSKNINLGTKYKIIIDMDKILAYAPSRKKFKFKSDGLNPFKDSKTIENINLRFFKNSTNSIDLKSIYDRIMQCLTYTYETHGKQYISDAEFTSLIQNIQEFTGYYNIIVNWSTIEGELITYENINKFLTYISTQTLSNDLQTQHNTIIAINDNKEKTILTLCEYLGKTEIGTQKGQIIFDGSNLKTIQKNKTSGWISDWLNYYFDNHIDNLDSELDKRAQFKQDFPGLYGTLQQIESMVE